MQATITLGIVFSEALGFCTKTRASYRSLLERKVSIQRVYIFWLYSGQVFALPILQS